ncbi:PGF-pre-PGF domain-containing protein [Natronobacterium gregoryi]|uniref:PGF-pre-PGF domain-containing protein n=2 Tax=Natronobacterium gregoryi TaxID=44930 RepID=L0AM23_NATGS|nr:PGF-pre-PGF domain-containing protein [Natronobacterium gregoryi]AFZ74222.1 hypothetical protein Natgr_3089 [Natronobacterium gregoryi SP2]ELY63678.1 hypothetical protein C490_15549 [Natronobacterium gregoryi SP2]PLK21990.1 PGF-pre-PGF domain-containing protein [Natronobacterium gregoryi SP2]SFI51777.1 PGF-pre-PGF domain-containing protein [Natronobacterium gregoryi]
MIGRERRLAAVAAVIALVVLGSVGGVAGQVIAQSDENATPDAYVVEQGDACQQIEPLSTAESVDSFYDYRNHETHPEGVDRLYSSYGTTHLQENNASLLFLHEGTDGISLVMVHDRVDGNTTGGVASFDVIGLPHEAKWEVKNDDYDGPTNMDEFDRGDGWASADWIWIESRTGGGAIQGGLNDPFAVTVHPAFNEDAEYYEDDDLYDPDWYDGGEIEEWHVLSGDATSPVRSELGSLSEPVTIRTGTCDEPTVTYGLTDDGIAATVEAPSPDDVARLQPTNGTTDDVRFEHVDVTDLEGTETVTFENDQPDGFPAAPDDRESLGSLAAATTQPVTATVSFSVDAATLEDAGLEPERVALYESDGGEWEESETTLTDETGAAYYFTAEVSSLERLTVAESEEAEATSEGDVSSVPGFGFVVTLSVFLALALTAAWTARARS